MKVLKCIAEMITLASMFLVSSGQNPMTVLCSIDWLMVSVHPFLLNSDVYVHFHELHLGDGCPPNHVQPYAYQFTYRVTECGIKAKVISYDMILYSTDLHYISKGTSSKQVIPVSCATHQKSPWLTKPCPTKLASGEGTKDENGDTYYNVFELRQPSQSSNCDCPPCVLNEEGRAQPGAQGGVAGHFSSIVDFSEDWCLNSDNLIDFM
ncbi:PREDICTED: placenta-specific protein 1 [Condylura cristata]|uniref:placenta-specific protein 1 n=1 Tax=Condylura cristata TaxID=143302 RepID=UPI000334721F|nr:PREDICTED: placenta-specific protein 1 [Condylura cristata]